MSPAERLDSALVQRGLVESRNKAQRLIMAGQVRVNGQVAVKPSQTVTQADVIELEQGPKYVSRGGRKLEAALEAYPIEVSGKVCADVGASTGGFTDCLLQHGAQRVYAIDSGRGQLHWSLRQDERVTVMESTNARYLENLPEAVELLTMDASFISVRLLLPPAMGWMAASGEAIILVKPQFEAGREQVGRGGVVRSEAARARAVRKVLLAASDMGWSIAGLIRSPITGPKGNVEFLAWLTVAGEARPITDLLEAVFGGANQV